MEESTLINFGKQLHCFGVQDRGPGEGDTRMPGKMATP